MNAERIPNAADARFLLDVGSKLAQARRQAGLKQEAACVHLGVSKETVSRWERGLNDPPFTQVQRLAKFYGVSLDWLSGEASHKTGLKPGHMIVHVANLEFLRDVRAKGGTLHDLAGISRPPSLDIAWEIPVRVDLLESAESTELSQEIITTIDELRTNTP